MDYLSSRSSSLCANIKNKINNNTNKIGIAIINISCEKDIKIYKFENNKCYKSSFQKINWSNPIFLNELSWEEKFKIKQKLIFINKLEEKDWINQKQKSFVWKIMSYIIKKQPLKN